MRLRDTAQADRDAQQGADAGTSTVPTPACGAAAGPDLAFEAALRPITWSDSFRMGDDDIDAEHRQFIDIVNRMTGAIRGRENAAAIAGICDQLVAHSEAHFRSEEEAMERHRFGGLEAHGREHERLLAFIRDKAAGLRATKDSHELVETALAIKDALLTHMFRVDVHYKTYFLNLRGR